jgi:high-affinity K+ transport system ATPase subunit B
MYLTLIVYYFLYRSDRKILKNANNVNDLDKWALKYVKKYNFNKDIILENIIKKVESGKKTNKIIKWFFILQAIFFIIYYTTKTPNIINIGSKTIYIGRDAILILNGVMILCLLTVLCMFLLLRLMHKRNIVAHEQFSRLFKDENNSQNNIIS